MPFTIVCPFCAARIKVADKHAGRIMPCPGCQKDFQVQVPVAKVVTDKPINGPGAFAFLYVALGILALIAGAGIGVYFWEQKQLAQKDNDKVHKVMVIEQPTGGMESFEQTWRRTQGNQK